MTGGSRRLLLIPVARTDEFRRFIIGVKHLSDPRRVDRECHALFWTVAAACGRQSRHQRFDDEVPPAPRTVDAIVYVIRVEFLLTFFLELAAAAQVRLRYFAWLAADALGLFFVLASDSPEPIAVLLWRNCYATIARHNILIHVHSIC